MSEATVPSDLEARLDAPRPKSLKFTRAGETVKGTFVRLERASAALDNCLIAVIQLDGGELVCLWLWHDALRSQLKRKRPQPGDQIMVRYNGKARSASGRQYHAYSVATDPDREAAAVSWDDAAPARQAEPADEDDGDGYTFDDGDPLPPEPDYLPPF
jgi:hypothetical protein